MPSLWREQFGLVGIEALACGLPCVASDTGGIPEWLIDGENGYLVPPGDKEALAEKLTLVLSSNELRERFSEYGQRFVEDKYGASKYAANLLRVVSEYT